MPKATHIDLRRTDDATKAVANAYDLMTDGYDDISSEGFYVNQYVAYDRFLRKHADKLRGRVLDCGCGSGIHTLAAAKYAQHVIGLDVAGQLIHSAKAKVPHGGFVNSDACELPFRSGSFDAVLSLGEVFSHIPKYRTAFSEVARVLKPGGFFVFSVLNKWNLRTIAYLREFCRAIGAPGGHWRRWDCEINDSGDSVSMEMKTFEATELQSLIGPVGFDVIDRTAIHVASLIIPLRLQYGRMNLWGRAFVGLGKLDSMIAHRPAFRDFGYTKMLVAQKGPC